MRRLAGVWIAIDRLPCNEDSESTKSRFDAIICPATGICILQLLNSCNS